MRVLLLSNINKIGKIGETVLVKDGFANNYLIPKNKAILASRTNIKELRNKKIEQHTKYNQIEINKINNLTLIIPAKTKNNNEIYGSINNKYIIKTLNKLNHKIKQENIKNKNFIKNTGIYEIEITYPKIKNEIKIHLIIKENNKN